jgi:retron-type reverse transcriptase
MLDAIVKELNISHDYLGYMANNSGKYYRTFKINNKREISSPNVLLKKIQKEIQFKLEERYTPHDSVYGFIKNKSYIQNAQNHLNKNYVLSLDIKNFFPSINSNMVKRLFIKLGCSEIDANTLSKLVTYKKVLPQGAPTSPVISNLIFSRYDSALYKFCSDRGITYTRYADDLSFSSNEDNLIKVVSFVRYILKGGAFKLNNKKTDLSNRYYRQEITGVTVNNGRLNIPKPWRKKVRALFNSANKHPFKSAKKYPEIVGKYNYLIQIKNYNNGNDVNEKLIKEGEKAIKKTRFIYKSFKFLNLQ